LTPNKLGKCPSNSGEDDKSDLAISVFSGLTGLDRHPKVPWRLTSDKLLFSATKNLPFGNGPSYFYKYMQTFRFPSEEGE
jgi:hypothetical protein